MELARVNLEAGVWGDQRFAHLERLLGYPATCRGHLAIARMAMVWGWQVEHYTPDAPCFIVAEAILEMALEVDGSVAAAALVRCGLGEATPDGLRIRGSSHERTGWLWRIRQRSEAGVEARKQRRSDRQSGNDADTSRPMVNLGSTVGTQEGKPYVDPLSSLFSGSEDPDVSVERARPDPVAELWAEQERQRADAIPGCRPLKLTRDRRKLIAARLADGYSVDDLRACLEYRGRAARAGDSQWFNGDANWSAKSVAYALGQQGTTARGRDGPAGSSSTQSRPLRGAAAAFANLDPEEP